MKNINLFFVLLTISLSMTILSSDPLQTSFVKCEPPSEGTIITLRRLERHERDQPNLNRHLFVSTLLNNTPLSEELVKLGADPTSKYLLNNSSLSKELVKLGADPTSEYQNQQTAITLAKLSGNKWLQKIFAARKKELKTLEEFWDN